MDFRSLWSRPSDHEISPGWWFPSPPPSHPSPHPLPRRGSSKPGAVALPMPGLGRGNPGKSATCEASSPGYSYTSPEVSRRAWEPSHPWLPCIPLSQFRGKLKAERGREVGGFSSFPIIQASNPAWMFLPFFLFRRVACKHPSFLPPWQTALMYALLLQSHSTHFLASGILTATTLRCPRYTRSRPDTNSNHLRARDGGKASEHRSGHESGLLLVGSSRNKLLMSCSVVATPRDVSFPWYCYCGNRTLSKG